MRGLFLPPPPNFFFRSEPVLEPDSQVLKARKRLMIPQSDCSIFQKGDQKRNYRILKKVIQKSSSKKLYKVRCDLDGFTQLGPYLRNNLQQSNFFLKPIILRKKNTRLDSLSECKHLRALNLQMISTDNLLSNIRKLKNLRSLQILIDSNRVPLASKIFKSFTFLEELKLKMQDGTAFVSFYEKHEKNRVLDSLLKKSPLDTSFMTNLVSLQSLKRLNLTIERRVSETLSCKPLLLGLGKSKIQDFRIEISPNLGEAARIFEEAEDYNFLESLDELVIYQDGPYSFEFEPLEQVQNYRKVFQVQVALINRTDISKWISKCKALKSLRIFNNTLIDVSSQEILSKSLQSLYLSFGDFDYNHHKGFLSDIADNLSSINSLENLKIKAKEINDSFLQGLEKIISQPVLSSLKSYAFELEEKVDEDPSQSLRMDLQDESKELFEKLFKQINSHLLALEKLELILFLDYGSNFSLLQKAFKNCKNLTHLKLILKNNDGVYDLNLPLESLPRLTNFCLETKNPGNIESIRHLFENIKHLENLENLRIKGFLLPNLGKEFIDVIAENIVRLEKLRFVEVGENKFLARKVELLKKKIDR